MNLPIKSLQTTNTIRPQPRFDYVLRKLKQLLGKQETLNAMGRDSLAPGRVIELKEAISVLRDYRDYVLKLKSKP